MWNERWEEAVQLCPDCGTNSSQEQAERERKCGQA